MSDCSEVDNCSSIFQNIYEMSHFVTVVEMAESIPVTSKTFFISLQIHKNHFFIYIFPKMGQTAQKTWDDSNIAKEILSKHWKSQCQELFLQSSSITSVLASKGSSWQLCDSFDNLVKKVQGLENSKPYD